MQASREKPLLGLITEGGRVDDSYNQYAYEGLARAADELGLGTQEVDAGSPDSLDATVRDLVDRGCTFIVAIGSSLGPLVERSARRFPAVRFVVVDHEPLPESRNVTGLTFAEDQAGFLAGALAGLVTEAGAVGFVGGVRVAAVRRFETGFEQGVAYTNRRAKVSATYTQSFVDPSAGAAAAKELLDTGADVIFAAAGSSGAGALRTAAQQGAWVIGVDQDQWTTTFQSGAVPGAERLLTSAVKRVDQVVYASVTRAIRGKLPAGTLTFDLSNDGVGLAPYHLADTAVPSEVRGKILEVTEGLRTGRIRVRARPEDGGLLRGVLPRLLAWDWRSALMPILAIFTALVLGGLFIAAFDPEVWSAFGEGFADGLGAAWGSIARAYTALFEGSFGSPARMIEGYSIYAQTGDSTKLLRSVRPLTESLRISTPYIFVGLAVAVGFRAGLFNIGAEGQYFIGGLTSVYVGYSATGLPWYLHLPLALLAGMAGGATWAAIAGVLKAKTGAHEVINTIMLNYVAYRLADYLLQVGGPMARPGDSRPVSPEVLPTAYLAQFLPENPSSLINAGIFLALAAVPLVYWLLFKTTIGFEIRAVGANPRAARTAGVSVVRNYVLAMGISGALAGLAASHDILGVLHYMPNAFFSGYGFDSIALALLGRSHPVGVLLSALLFGFLRAGAQRMQAPPAGVPIDIISVLQALIIIFIAAPEVIRYIYRLRAPTEAGQAVFIRGWGQV